MLYLIKNFMPHPYAHLIIGTTETINQMMPSSSSNILSGFFMLLIMPKKSFLQEISMCMQHKKIAQDLMSNSSRKRPAGPNNAFYTYTSMTKDIIFPSQQTTMVVGQFGH